ncbi:GtrA family protein [Arsenophonus sp. aPb]|uniref:GtrA family protein n=1 Tax=Arsenophonus sp. aPb TaxID=3041619 RepID=UPI002469BB59|nr:GtrA family protein [Arsenophonus sp. aPb]WGL98762.1 GtrA family protein [Arsenophonus sp. aPb]
MICQFSRYFIVGLVNTLLHWGVFVSLVYIVSISQASANLVSFIIAVTFSFFANAKFTFRKKATVVRYFTFVIFMGMLSYYIGYMADKFNAHPLVTLIVFSIISLVVGFLYSKLFVFKGIE